MKENIDKIIDGACEIWGVERNDVLKDKRQQRLVFARATISYFLLRTLNLSLSEIGRNLKRSHSSISNHLKIYDDEYQYNKEFRTVADAMKNIAKDIVLEIKTDFQCELEDELKEIIG